MTREKIVERIERIREMKKAEEKDANNYHNWAKVIWLDGQIFALENILMEL